MSEKRMAAFGVLLLVDFVLSAVMLVTDKNLQTDFGFHSAYYLHWYGVLAMAIVDLVVALALLVSSSPSVAQQMSSSVRRIGVIAALVWTIVAIVVSVGIVTTWSQVGFANMSQFEQYLFGVTPYPGALYYIPWLYDLLLAAYIVTAVVGALAIRRAPTPPATAPAS
ncbi:MAG: hypothetical protein WA691_03485 [Thermoplasmata archaeon]